MSGLSRIQQPAGRQEPKREGSPMHPPPADCLEAMIGSLEPFLWGVGPVRPGCGQVQTVP
ncbi:hypothetical protein CPAR01_00012 [Colletotrichum paranaense]|uniref:Uncharacterized protein n=1 Tax=Colletotrichum paranaense TaxID=1914294 RepID=A0ABQ9T2P4_9PEZI|nr:uncharacterized protein CPAR01_00012 [Colletotrichum paranaense]KAK1546045.1 hypothetical protein CPAR01_00012 [Colletotrichum paranaense]